MRVIYDTTAKKVQTHKAYEVEIYRYNIDEPTTALVIANNEKEMRAYVKRAFKDIDGGEPFVRSAKPVTVKSTATFTEWLAIADLSKVEGDTAEKAE